MQILELRLAARELAPLRRFYGEALGLELSGGAAGELAVHAGATRLVFAEAGGGAAPRYHLAFNIPPNLHGEARGWLAGRAPLLADGGGCDLFAFEGAWDAESTYFADPAGNILELIARRRLPSAPGPFGPAQLLAVSEIGLASQDVLGLAAQIGAVSGAAPLGEGDASFCAVGDDAGLLIIARAGRIWMPESGVPALPLPVEALIEQGGRRYRLSGPPYQVAPA